MPMRLNMTQVKERGKVTTIVPDPTTLIGFTLRRVFFAVLALFAGGVIFAVVTFFLVEYGLNFLETITNSATTAVAVIISIAAAIAMVLIGLLYGALYKVGFFTLTSRASDYCREGG